MLIPWIFISGCVLIEAKMNMRRLRFKNANVIHIFQVEASPILKVGFGGRFPTPKVGPQPYYFGQFSQRKMHENEKKSTGGGTGFPNANPESTNAHLINADHAQWVQNSDVNQSGENRSEHRGETRHPILRSKRVHLQGNTPKRVHLQENTPKHVHQKGNTPKRVHLQENTPKHVHQKGNTPKHVHLQENTPKCAHLQENTPKCIHLQGNTPKHVHIQGNTSKCAQLQGNIPKCAHLQGNIPKHVLWFMSACQLPCLGCVAMVLKPGRAWLPMLHHFTSG